MTKLSASEKLRAAALDKDTTVYVAAVRGTTTDLIAVLNGERVADLVQCYREEEEEEHQQFVLLNALLKELDRKQGELSVDDESYNDKCADIYAEMYDNIKDKDIAEAFAGIYWGKELVEAVYYDWLELNPQYK